MKKKLFYVLIILGLLTLGLMWFGGFVSRMPCPPPVRPVDVPKNAVWKGACDGGHWIELIDFSESKYHFKIYRGYDGELICNAKFRFNCKNQEAIFTEKNWRETGFFYTGDFGSEPRALVFKTNSGVKCGLYINESL